MRYPTFSRHHLLLLAFLPALGCVDDYDEEDLHDYVDPGPFETVEQDINVSQVTGCSLASVRGLDDQIVSEMNCLIPGVLVDFSDLNVSSGGSSTYFLLQPQAKEGLRRALQARGQRMTVNTAYRSIVQQYLLYRWYQSGQCGIGLAAAPGRSNHQSGLALDVSDNAGWRSSLQGNGWTWFGSNDAVHYDYTAGGTRDIRGTAVLAFQKLWNRHNPGDRISEDGSYGPQTEARLRSSPTGGFSGNNPCGQAPTPRNMNFDMISASIRDISGQPRDLVAEGTSQGIFDALEGQTLEIDVVVRNGDGRPATDEVLIGYDITSPWLTPTGYTIETDHPAYDQQTWQVNDANDRPDNPDHSAPAPAGRFNLNRFSPGESKRIRLQLQPPAYTFGVEERPHARFWVKHIGDYYGEQDGWDDAVEVNLRGELLRKQARVDVFAADQWEFNGADPLDLEGWGACRSAGIEAAAAQEGALSLRLVGADPYICAPAWTRLDADAYRSVALRVRHSLGPQRGQLFFNREGEGFAEERSAPFDTRGDGQWEDLLIDLGDHPAWTGAIRGLRLDPVSAVEAPATFEVDYVRPSTEAEPPSGAANNTPGNNNPDPNLNNTPGDTPDAGSSTPDAGSPDPGDPGDPDSGGAPGDSPDADGAGGGAAFPTTNTGCGCQQLPAPPGGAGLLGVLLGALLVAGARRR